MNALFHVEGLLRPNALCLRAPAFPHFGCRIMVLVELSTDPRWTVPNDEIRILNQVSARARPSPWLRHLIQNQSEAFRWVILSGAKDLALRQRISACGVAAYGKGLCKFGIRPPRGYSAAVGAGRSFRPSPRRRALLQRSRGLEPRACRWPPPALRQDRGFPPTCFSAFS